MDTPFILTVVQSRKKVRVIYNLRGNTLTKRLGNTGCGIRANSNKSFGAAFNKNGGGVYASELHLERSLNLT